MKRSLIILLLFLLIPLSSIVQAESKSRIKTTQLTDKLYLLSVDEGSYTTNALAFIGEDGLLLVDAQASDVTDDFKAAVDAFGKGIPKYIINTHRHVEHIGGNAIFGETPVVIAHVLVPTKLKSGSSIFDEYSRATLPDITINDSLSLFFNGEWIRIFSIAGTHDDNEIAVHFTESGYVHLSSIVNGFCFPSIDADGDVFKFAEVVKMAASLLPDDVNIISGHNGPGTEIIGTHSALADYQNMISETIRIVKEGIDAGKTAEQMKKEKVLSEFASYAKSYVSEDEWIDYIIEGYESIGKPVMKSIYEPLYHTWKSSGVEAAIERYHAIKKDSLDTYEIRGFELMVIGTKFLDKELLDEAAQFIELNIEEYPDDKYGYYTYYQLALVYEKQGAKQKAIEACEKAIELNSEFAQAAKLLKKLKE